MTRPGQIPLANINRYIQEHKTLLDPNGKRNQTPPLTSFNYTPQLISKLSVLAESFTRLHEYITHNYGTFRETLGYEKNLDQLLLNTPTFTRNLVLTRADVFLTNQGIKVVEVNCQSPGGNEDSAIVEQLFEKHLGFEKRKKLHQDRLANVIEAILDSYQEQAKEKGFTPKEKPHLVLMEHQKDINILEGRFNIFVNRMQKLNLDCDLVSTEEIEFRKNQVYARGKQIDLIYCRIITDSLENANHLGNYDFAKRLDESKVAIVPAFSAKRADSKKTLELFSNPKYHSLFPKKLQSDLVKAQQYIPTTRSLSNPDQATELTTELIERQNELVLKSANAVGSSEVYLGSDLSPAEWARKISSVIGEDWVVQDKINLPTMEVDVYDHSTNRIKTVDMIYNVCPFAFNGKFKGLLVRASTDQLTSEKTGAIYSILPIFKSD